jgi:hypothetical protein
MQDSEEIGADAVSESQAPTAEAASRGDNQAKRDPSFPAEPDWSDMASRFSIEGYSRILQIALQHARKTGHRTAESLWSAFQASGDETYWDMAGNTLCIMPKRMVYELVAGNMAEAFESGKLAQTEFFMDVTKFDKQGRRGQPVLYLRTFGDSSGRPLFVWQVKVLLKELESYEQYARTGDARAFMIDSVSDPDWSEATESDTSGKRKYLDPSKSSRRKVLRVFCAALQRQIWGMDDDEKFTPSFHYIGYAFDAEARKEQHAKTGTRSTNWLGSLVVSICNYKWPDRGYCLHFHVTCLIANPAQAAVGEMLLTVIGHGYYWTGRGFNIGIAGASVNSIYMETYTETRRNELWKEWKGYIVEETPWLANLESDTNLVQGHRSMERMKPLEEAKATSSACIVQQSRFTELYESIDWTDPQIDPALRERIMQTNAKITHSKELRLEVLRDSEELQNSLDTQ